MKSPSSYDGKPVGTPTEAVSPWRAGVTMGLDQIERVVAARREAKRVRIERRRMGIPEPHRNEPHWLVHSSRRKLVQHWQNLVEKTSRRRKQTWTIAAVAARWGVTQEYVLAELQWLHKRQDVARRRKRRAKIRKGRSGDDAT